MRIVLTIVTIVVALAAGPAAAYSFAFEDIGLAVPSDCASGFPPQPLCVVLDGTASANDVPDVIPGAWTWTAHGQVTFFAGAGTFSFDDASSANNDFAGTWTNVLDAPGVDGVAHSSFQYVVTSGSGIFAGRIGRGVSDVQVVVAPAGFDANGAPLFAAPCDGSPAGYGRFCEQGRFAIAEPSTLAVVLVALGAMGCGIGGIAGQAARRRGRAAAVPAC